VLKSDPHSFFKEKMMRKLVMILLLAGLSSGGALALDGAITVKLEPQNDSEQSGTATLMPEGDQTKVVILIPNAPKGAAQPAHIHLGQCDNLDKAPKWNLDAVKDGQSTTVVPVSLETILQDKTAINIHKSAEEVQIYVACGNIVPLM
jgi:hypothetical protein